MRQRFSQMMAGRNGNDQFNRFLLIANVVLLLISSIFKNSFGKYLYYFVLVLLGYMYFRMFSRNLTKRREENGKYMRLQYKFAAIWISIRKEWWNLRRRTATTPRETDLPGRSSVKAVQNWA